ncbi:MAG TPA: dolichol-phosphate mannosyltransferase, partial [Cyanobacteria bacterium UBA12227]|nr:dolichol-phosphate mannosyltransferase [Cyanobacteria bacterium UBA12227]
GVGLTPHLGIIYLICLLFTIGVSLLVPVGTAGLIAGGKQWGARFLLILVPIISLMVVKELTLIRKTDKPILGYISLFIFSMLLLIGLHKNTYDGVVYLQKNHQGILPAIEFLKKQENTPIAISHQFVAQALEPGLGERRLFFKAEDRDQLVKLGAALVEQGQQKFTYICYPFSKCNIAEENSDNFKFNKGTETFKIELSELGKFGKYPIYEAEIINQS